MKSKRQTGTIFEEKAAEYIVQQGYQIIEKNYRCYFGEIDLIAMVEGYLVFLEVKYRKSTQKGTPEEAVNLKKQRVICMTADYYRMRHQISEVTPCRFDVVAFTNEEVKIYKNAFDYVGKGE